MPYLSSAYIDHAPPHRRIDRAPPHRLIDHAPNHRLIDHAPPLRLIYIDHTPSHLIDLDAPSTRNYFKYFILDEYHNFSAITLLHSGLEHKIYFIF